MRKVFLVIALFALAALGARADNIPIILVQSAPSGACTNGQPMQLVIPTGVLYSCQAGTWGVVGAGAGGPPTGSAGGDLSGTYPNPGVAALKSVPFCTGYTPTNGQSVTLTTASSPNPCYTAVADLPLAGGVPMMGATGGNPIAGGINATQYLLNGVSIGPGSVFYADDYPTSGCVANSTTYHEQISCAYYTACAQAASQAGNTVLILGNQTYPTSVELSCHAASTQSYTVSIIGQGSGYGLTPTGSVHTSMSAIYATASMTAVIANPTQTDGSLLPNVAMQGFTIDANQFANSCADWYGFKTTNNIRDIQCQNAIGTDHWMAIGDHTAATIGFQVDTNGIFIQGAGSALANWAAGTVSLSGGVPSVTISSGGAYRYATPLVEIKGLTCATYGTGTPTMTGSSPSYAVASVALSGFATCTGSGVVQIVDLPAATYGLRTTYSDSSNTRVVVQGVGRLAGIFNAGSNTRFYAPHIYGGMPYGISDYGASVWVSPSLDSLSEYGFDLESASTIISATNFWNGSYPFAGSYYFGTSGTTTNGASISDNWCGSNQTAGGYALFSNSSGPITSGYPSEISLINDQSCGGTYGTVNVTTGPLQVGGTGIVSGTIATLATGTTIAPIAAINNLTGTTAIATITVPSNFTSTVGGCLTFNPASTVATTTAGNIAAIYSLVGGNSYQACYNGTSWYFLGGTSSGSSVGTAGQVQMVGGTAGSFTASTATDNGSLFSISEPLAATQGQFASPSAAAKAAVPSGANGFSCDESATVGVPASAVDYLRCDATQHAMLLSQNDGSESPLASSATIQTALKTTLYMSPWSGTNTISLASSANHILGWAFSPSQTITFSTIYAGSGTADASNLYSMFILSSAGAILCHPTTGIVIPTANTTVSNACSEGNVTLTANQVYIFGTTGNSATGRLLGVTTVAAVNGPFWSNNIAGCSSSSGVVSGTCTIALSPGTAYTNAPNFTLQ